MNQPLMMSKKERERLQVLTRLDNKQLGDAEAAEILGISVRQLYRVKARWRTLGDAGLVHRLRARTSNRRTAPELRGHVLDLYRQRYSDYGPTLFAEMLLSHHQIQLAPETLRQWLIAAGLWERSRAARRHRKKRPRRHAIGALLQLDGSFHDWFEGRGPSCCLLVLIDDASSRVFMRFAVSENAQDVMTTLLQYIQHYGIPQAIYTDGGSVFYSDTTAGKSSKPTDYALALTELGIQMIRARSPQAKGRVERSNRTQQDRLIKALRRAGISTIEQANHFLLDSYLQEHNTRFARSSELTDVHRSADGIRLEEIFSFRCARVVNNDFTVRLNSAYLQLLPSKAAVPPPKSLVEIRQSLDGSVHIYWQSQEIRFQYFEHKPVLPKLSRPQKVDHPWRGKRLGDSRRNGSTTRSKLRAGK